LFLFHLQLKFTCLHFQENNNTFLLKTCSTNKWKKNFFANLNFCSLMALRRVSVDLWFS
jgi:hypothetical protein